MNSEMEQRGKEKFSKLPHKFPTSPSLLKKPAWLKVKSINATGAGSITASIIKDIGLTTVCHEANCPNISECFSRSTATFLIMGTRCTRRCTFCDIAHAVPLPLDEDEPYKIALAAQKLNLKYTVITSVTRDDLYDGGAQHFCQVISALRQHIPSIRIEILVPDFRGRSDTALELLAQTPPDVFNHNIETIPRLYQQVRPGANYNHSLDLLSTFKEKKPDILTKSGFMLGLGETFQDIEQTLLDLAQHKVDIVTIGQYLSPSKEHFPVQRYVSPDEFSQWEKIAKAMGFKHVFSGVFVRSSYHADQLVHSDKQAP